MGGPQSEILVKIQPFGCVAELPSSNTGYPEQKGQLSLSYGPPDGPQLLFATDRQIGCNECGALESKAVKRLVYPGREDRRNCPFRAAKTSAVSSVLLPFIATDVPPVTERVWSSIRSR